MKHINITRYIGSNHTTLVAEKKNNVTLASNVQATALSQEEAEAQLKADLSLQVEGEFDLIITDYDRKKFTSLTTEKLLSYYEKTEKMLGAHEMVEAILIKRGALSLPSTEDVEEPEKPVEGEAKQEKAPREYNKCMTEEGLQNRLEAARLNYGKIAKFLCTKDKEEHFGIIRSARLDKRSGFIQYRIEILEKPNEDATIYTERSGKIYGKGDDSKNLTIFDETPAEVQLSNPTKEEPAQPAEENNEAKS